jgi:S-ribosylhomocysteine lyase LuxS involved in autoinducer biosynthesis
MTKQSMKIVVTIDGQEYVPKIQLDQCLALLAAHSLALTKVRQCAMLEVEALKSSMANFPTGETEPG